MALYRVQVLHSRNNQEWFNTWRISATNNDNAIQVASNLLDFHQAIHAPGVLIDSARVSTQAEDGRNYQRIPFAAVGSRSISGEYLPMVLCVLCDLSNESWNDPSRKYFHIGIGENEQNDGILSSGVATTIINAFLTLLTNISAYGQIVDAAGAEIAQLTVNAKLTTHQFRRRWARRTP